MARKVPARKEKGKFSGEEKNLLSRGKTQTHRRVYLPGEDPARREGGLKGLLF